MLKRQEKRIGRKRGTVNGERFCSAHMVLPHGSLLEYNSSWGDKKRKRRMLPNLWLKKLLDLYIFQE